MLSIVRTDTSCGPRVESLAIFHFMVWCRDLVACLWVCLLVYVVFRVCVVMCSSVCVCLRSRVYGDSLSACVFILLFCRAEAPNSPPSLFDHV